MTPKEIEKLLELENERAMAGNYRNATEATVEDLKATRTQSIDIEPLEEGDVFTIPQNFKILKRPVGTKAKVFFINLAVTDKNGELKVATVFPSSFTKKKVSLKWDSDKQEYVKEDVIRANGTASKEYSQHVDMYESLKAIAGKKIKVTKKIRFTGYQFGSREVTESSILIMDFAE